MNRSGRYIGIAALLLTVLPGGLHAQARVRLRERRAGVYSATATVPLLPGRSPAIALANRTLQAEARKEVRDFVRRTRRDLRAQGHLRLPYQHLTTGTTCIVRRDLASAYLTTYEFMAGAHGMTTYEAVNVGLVHGRPRLLTLSDLFLPSVPAAQVAAERVKTHLRKEERAAWLAPDAGSDVRPKDADLIRTFVITPNGLTFLIEPYIAGPYSSGSFFVKVPFAEFADRLNPNGPLRGVLPSLRAGRRGSSRETPR